MPNHVTTRCIVTGPAEEVARFRETCIVERTAEDQSTFLSFDFDTIIPMPKGMQDVTESGDLSYWMELFGLEKPKFVPLGDNGARDRLLTFFENFCATDDNARAVDSFKNFLLARRMLKEHGAKSWYDWSIREWGTKWGSYSFSIDNDDEGEPFAFRFDTAWAFPEPIFQQLVIMFPLLTFDLATYDEGSNFAGTGLMGPGEAANPFTIGDATDEIYEEVFGHPPETYDDEDEDAPEATDADDTPATDTAEG